ncbi:Sensory box/GGDEF family protein [Minicystis rosea]|nr:Sensory box/GGDEF family protein [Minicystis rosea]
MTALVALRACAACDAMKGSYQPGLVVLSVLIAIVASYTVLDSAARVSSSSGTARAIWLGSGAAMMGGGIWSMHFVGMEAFRMPMPMSYDLPTTMVSMLVAILVSLAALNLVSQPHVLFHQLVAGGLFMGAAIATMHYVGMAAMRMPATIRYDPPLFALSLLIAVVASFAALWLAFRFRGDVARPWSFYKLLSATAMGGAIAGMHYVGMAAAIFEPADVSPSIVDSGIDVSELGAAAIGVATLGGLGLLLLGSVVDIERRRTETALRFLADASAALGESLDADQILETAARLAVPTLGDLCFIERVEGGDLRIVAAHHLQRTKVVTARGLVGKRRRIDPESSEAVQRVFRDGRSACSADELYVDPSSLESEPGRRARGACSSITVPLRQRARIVGLMTIVSIDPQRYQDRSETALADDLGRRISAALDNALLFREAQDAIALRDDFLCISSHELKTPLTSQSLQIARLRHKMEDGTLWEMPRDRAGSMIGMIVRQSDRLNRLIDNLLDVSRITAGRLALDLEEVDLAAVARDVVERFRGQYEARNTTVTLRTAEPVLGRWDRGRLEQVVTNLLTNAIKYGDGRPIELEVSPTPRGACCGFAITGSGSMPRSTRASSSASSGSGARRAAASDWVCSSPRRSSKRITGRSRWRVGSVKDRCSPSRCRAIRRRP